VKPLLEQLDNLKWQARSIRVERWEREYPEGHPERPRAPKWVAEYYEHLEGKGGS
jgi:hypothetical protein